MKRYISIFSCKLIRLWWIAAMLACLAPQAEALVTPLPDLYESFASQSPAVASDLLIEDIIPIGYADNGDCLDMVVCVEAGTHTRVFCIVQSPFGLAVVLIHGVNTDAAWFKTAEQGLKAYWKKNNQPEQAIIHFKWGDPGTMFGLSRKQGGHPHYATQSVKEMSSSGALSKERGYMLTSVTRLKNLLNLLNTVAKREGSKEPITIIAHSQGTIISLGALQQGAKIDNLIMMGSPLDVLPFNKKKNDLLKAKSSIRGSVFNYWSSKDEWAWIKGGIGAYGSDVGKIKELRWITHREFGPGKSILGYKLPSVKPFDEYDHSDYMLRAAFFQNIHGKDVAPAPDTKLSTSTQIQTLKKLAETW